MDASESTLLHCRFRAGGACAFHLARNTLLDDSLQRTLLLFNTVHQVLVEVVGQAVVPEVVDGVLVGVGFLDPVIVPPDYRFSEILRKVLVGQPQVEALEYVLETSCV